MSLSLAAPALKVVNPGEGDSGMLAPGIGVQFKLDGADTLGALSIVEHPFAVGGMVPPHLHTREDEFSIVTEGRIGFRSEDKEVVLEAGGYIIKPRGEVHSMWNAGPKPARMIEIISPRVRGVLRELRPCPRRRRVTPQELERLSEQYGLPFARPAWLPDVIARYGLTPPPGLD